MTASMIELRDVLPIAATGFTVASFWWIWLRRGRLTISPPRYIGMASTPAQLRIRFPLAFRNGGARTIVVEDLRVVIDGNPLDWITTRKTLKPESEDVVDFACPFLVGGRSATVLIAEFGDNGDTWRPQPSSSCSVTLEQLVRREWRKLGEFEWWTPHDNLGKYLARRNRPESSSV